MKLELILIKIMFFISVVGYASDGTWANWLGPNNNGSIEKKIDFLSGPTAEFPILWVQSVGNGWSAPIVSDGIVYLHDRMHENENLIAYNATNGEKKWQISYPSKYRDDFGMEDGPRSTPAVKNGLLVSHGPQGLLHAIKVEDGQKQWVHDLAKGFGSPKGFFGRCSSPLIIGDRVIVAVGGRAGMVAFSLLTGDVIWESKPYGNEYASLVPYTIGTKIFVVAFMREGLVVVDSKDGQEVFFDSFSSPIRASVNAASPLVTNHGLFLSSCYEVGAGLWNIEDSQKMKNPTFISKWQKQEVLDCHYSTPVSFEDCIFGFHGRQERGTVLRCINIIDGKVMWSTSLKGTGNLIRLGTEIVCLTEHGELIIFQAKPDSFSILMRQQILGRGRAHFAYANGKIFARDSRRLICLGISAN